LELGVSKSLVSFVMNGKAKEMRVSDAMAEKIILKAKQIGYKANPMAQALRTGKTQTIGLIVADISNSFYSKIARSIENSASKNGYHVIFGSSDESGIKSKELINLFFAKRIDGLIISPTIEDKDHIVKLQEHGIPVVLIDRYFKDIKTNMVISNNLNGTFHIVKRLIENGNKKIGFITHNTITTATEYRVKGYQKALKKFGIPYDVDIIREVPHINNRIETENSVRELIELQKVDAIFFFNNTIALEGGKIIRDVNKKKLRNIEIGCFDSSSYLELLDVPYIAAVQQVEEIGNTAIKLLFLQMESKLNIITKKVLKVKLIDKL